MFLKCNTVQPRDPASPALAFAQEKRGDAHGRRVQRRSLQLQPGRPPRETAPALPSEQRSSVPPRAPDKVLDQGAGAEGTHGRSPWKILESATYAGLEAWGRAEGRRAGEALGGGGCVLTMVMALGRPTGLQRARSTCVSPDVLTSGCSPKGETTLSSPELRLRVLWQESWRLLQAP